MQSKETKSIDARTFCVLWSTMTKTERDDVSYEILKTRACKSRQTIWNWATGKTSPMQPLIQETASKCINKVLGINTTPRTLFPSTR